MKPTETYQITEFCLWADVFRFLEFHSKVTADSSQNLVKSSVDRKKQKAYKSCTNSTRVSAVYTLELENTNRLFDFVSFDLWF